MGRHDRDISKTTKLLPNLMKTNEPVPNFNLYKQTSNDSMNGILDNNSKNSYKNQITSTPLNMEHKHPELINAPQKSEDRNHKDIKDKKEKENTEYKEKPINLLKNSTSLNLPNYKDLNSVTMKTLENQNSSKNSNNGRKITVSTKVVNDKINISDVNKGVNTGNTNNSNINNSNNGKSTSNTSSSEKKRLPPTSKGFY